MHFGNTNIYTYYIYYELKIYIYNKIKDDQYIFQFYYTSIPTGILCHEILHVYHVIKINLKIYYIINVIRCL